ncbi:MAG: hypothetical protein ACM3ZA_13930 [Bacillota bacterium]
MRNKIWITQAVSGLILLVLLGLHLLANHTAGGLLDYAGVLRRLKDPATFALETAFLVFVTYHALVGLRAILLDYIQGERAGRYVTGLTGVVGVFAVAYGVWLSVSLYLR